jgi:hypothetical protein
MACPAGDKHGEAVVQYNHAQCSALAFVLLSGIVTMEVL